MEECIQSQPQCQLGRGTDRKCSDLPALTGKGQTGLGESGSLGSFKRERGQESPNLKVALCQRENSTYTDHVLRIRVGHSSSGFLLRLSLFLCPSGKSMSWSYRAHAIHVSGTGTTSALPTCSTCSHSLAFPACCPLLPYRGF